MSVYSMRFFLLVPAILLVSLVSVSRADITVSQSLNKATIPYEDSVTLDLVLTWNGPQTAYRFPALRPQLDRLRVTGFTSSVNSTGTGADEITKKLFRYILVPTSSGTARIEAISIEYLRFPDSIPGQLMTEPMTVAIAEAKPVAGKGEKPPTLITKPVMIILLSALALSITGVTIFILRLRKPKERPLSPAKLVLGKLAELKQDAGSDVKRFQTGAYKILVGYVSNRCRMILTGRTTEEIVHLLDSSDLPAEQKEKIGAWLLQAEREKFSPLAPDPGKGLRLETEIRELFEKID